MGLLDDAVRTVSERHPTRCRVALLREELGDQAKEFDEMIQRSDIPAQVVLEVLRSHGYSLGDRTLRNHVQGRCCCGTS